MLYTAEKQEIPMPAFFKPNKIITLLSERDKTDQSAAGEFSNTKKTNDLLAWIHAILDGKNEPSAEIKRMLIQAFELLKKSVLSTDSIERLTKRLKNEDTPAAKAVSEAHSKVNLRSIVKPVPSIFSNKAATLEASPSLVTTQGLFRPRPGRSTPNSPENLLRFKSAFRG